MTQFQIDVGFSVVVLSSALVTRKFIIAEVVPMQHPPNMGQREPLTLPSPPNQIPQEINGVPLE